MIHFFRFFFASAVLFFAAAALAFVAISLRRSDSRKEALLIFFQIGAYP